ncbi:hypothetical protein STIAU_8132 [Stigmatella aurantiaca DW4/3-1]|uniref:Uncharacterized protein n=1 Tax=Stigmatella aurantiaca (strain DW4/3-1) TaxID=378806 RepID=Q08VQ9_STIAD|nr:hypothetical protein STIAU_8132 [Stigmatella aurantiaca DW4/3-1]
MDVQRLVEHAHPGGRHHARVCGDHHHPCLLEEALLHGVLHQPAAALPRQHVVRDEQVGWMDPKLGEPFFRRADGDDLIALGFQQRVQAFADVFVVLDHKDPRSTDGVQDDVLP